MSNLMNVDDLAHDLNYFQIDFDFHQKVLKFLRQKLKQTLKHACQTSI